MGLSSTNGRTELKLSMDCMEGEDELLARARRLCEAARALQLPALLPGISRSSVDEAAKGRDETTHRSSQRPSTETLPLITAPSAARKGNKAVQLSEERGRRLQQEGARRLGEDSKKRQERELEKVKQAQERARARVVRTNQLENQQTLRTTDLQQSDAASAAQQCAEKLRRAQESRRRAKERIRTKHQQEVADATSPTTAPGAGKEPATLKAFRRKTIKRLQALNPLHIQSDKHESADTPERNEDADADQKFLERKLRQETTARLRRMKQLAENQKRQEQEEFEQGLQKFKKKLRELDRVAKGLSKQPSLPQINKPTAFESDEAREEIAPADTRCPSPVHDELVWSINQDAESSSDSDDSGNKAPNPVAHAERTEITLARTAETSTRGSKCRLPAWKQPPVPIQPTHCYSYKAILPAYSRASVTAPSYASVATMGSGTRLRAQDISRQMKS